MLKSLKRILMQPTSPLGMAFLADGLISVEFYHSLALNDSDLQSIKEAIQNHVIPSITGALTFPFVLVG
jgi:hypothetical protein